MGYDLHITRKRRWSDDEGPAITEAEWRSLIESDPDLSLDQETRYVTTSGEYVYAAWKGEPGALAWFDGEIRRKNPDTPLVVKMVEIAKALGATVQGDDGEVYGADGTSIHPQPSPSPPPPRPGMFERFRRWLRTRRRLRDLRQAAPALRVGSRVRNVFGQTGTVTEIDPRANSGLGRVRVRLDDGREQSVALVASGLDLIE